MTQLKIFGKNIRSAAMRTATVTIALAITFSGTVAPKALGNEIGEASSESCTTSSQDNPVQLPYAYIGAAEDLIADGIIDRDLIDALEGAEVNYEIVGPAPRPLPAIAAAAVAVVAWCAKGALSSLAPSALQQAAHQAHNGIEPPSWVMNAIFGCAGGPVLGALTSQTVRIKFAGAVLAAIIKLRNFG